MSTELYLDTARFGRMRARAQRAETDFARLCGDEGGSAYVEDFLRSGTAAWPASLTRRYPGLGDWRGVSELKRSFRELLGFDEEAGVSIASRSGTLMRLAARALFGRCRRVLHTDLEWPPYLEILRAEGHRRGGETTCVAVRAAIETAEMDADDLAEYLAAECRRQGCDGLFLSAVGYRGVRLPAEGVIRRLTRDSAVRFAVLDAAQAIGHAPLEADGYDVVIGGVHKWLRAGRPLGVAFATTPCARKVLSEASEEMKESLDLDDPLLDLVAQLDGGRTRAVGGTADLSALFCAAAVIAAECGDHLGPAEKFASRLANAYALRWAVKGTAWEPVAAVDGFRSAIVLCRRRDEWSSVPACNSVRAAFQRRGIALTAYDDGAIRLSVPYAPWEGDALRQLRSAFRRCS